MVDRCAQKETWLAVRIVDFHVSKTRTTSGCAEQQVGIVLVFVKSLRLEAATLSNFFGSNNLSNKC